MKSKCKLAGILIILLGIFLFMPATFITVKADIPDLQDSFNKIEAVYKKQNTVDAKWDKAPEVTQKVNEFNSIFFGVIEGVASVICIYGVYKLGLAMSSHEARDYTQSLTIIIVSGALACISGWIDQVGGVKVTG